MSIGKSNHGLDPDSTSPSCKRFAPESSLRPASESLTRCSDPSHDLLRRPGCESPRLLEPPSMERPRQITAGSPPSAPPNRRRVTAERLAKSPPDVLLPSLLRYTQSGRSDPSPAGPTLLCLSSK